jgi:hypothetical protein
MQKQKQMPMRPMPIHMQARMQVLMPMRVLVQM